MQDELDIPTLTTKQAWEMFLAEGGKEEQELYKEVRYGINIKFDIHYYIEDYLIMKPKAGAIIIKGKSYKLEEYWSEMEDRTIRMKEWLMELNKETGGADL